MNSAQEGFISRLTQLRKESVNWKIGHEKLPKLKHKEKKEWKWGDTEQSSLELQDNIK